jgi:hypothetical protein
MSKEPNTQAQDAVAAPSEDWTNEAFPEANDKQEDAGLDSQEAVPTPNDAELENKANAVEESNPNDEKRFQYWQSQADKKDQEIAALKSQMQQPQTPQAPVEPAEPEVKEFPPPPNRPRKPAGYSKEEAISDPSSKSAMYQDSLDGWRDKMDKYNNLYAQYNVALAQERMEALENRLNQADQAQVEAQQNQQAMSELGEYVQATYGLDDTETQDFIETMSHPDSLSIGNLVDLYKMKGKQVIQNVPTQVGTNVGNTGVPTSEPSELFNQVKRAQSVPSPMGVISGQGEDKSTTDSIMDEMIDTFNKKNPF